MLSLEQSQEKTKKYFIVIAEHRLQMQFSFNQKCNKSSNMWRIAHLRSGRDKYQWEVYIQATLCHDRTEAQFLHDVALN